MDWDSADANFLEFCRRAVRFRKQNQVLRQKRFLHAQPRPEDGKPDLFWRKPDGQEMRPKDWTHAELRFLGVEMRMAHSTPAYEQHCDAIYAIFNTGEDVTITLPDAPDGQCWQRVFDTAPDDPDQTLRGDTVIESQSVAVFKLTPTPPSEAI